MIETVETRIIQLNITEKERPEKRLETVCTILDAFSNTEKIDLIMLPELWYCGFFAGEDYYASSAKTEEIKEILQNAAIRLGCYILGGSLIEHSEDSYYNTSYLFDRQGKEIAAYRKMHLFGYESPEVRLLTPGDTVVVVDTDFGKLGLCTCYDLRFPEQFRRMQELGAVCFAVVSDWPEARLSHWRLFNQVRALENQCFLISCNATGMFGQVKQAGHSMAVEPDGEILLEADTTNVGNETCDKLEEKWDGAMIYRFGWKPGCVFEARAQFPAVADRRIIE